MMAFPLIPSLLVTLAGAALAQDPAPPTDLPEDEDVLSPYRARFEGLVERSIGTASVPVAFNWRRTDLQIAVLGSYLGEQNNFNSMRAGALLRFPSNTALLELGVSYADTWDSPSSRLLAFTPYRQPGHPDRMEVDLTLGLPLAEGVVTTFPRFLPAVEMVLVGYVGVRYFLYPTAFAGRTPGQVLTAILAPALSADEIDNLEEARLDGMQVDPGRYGVLVGLGDDLYLESGLFLSPRMMVAIPILEPVTETELLLWTDLSLAVGMAF